MNDTTIKQIETKCEELEKMVVEKEKEFEKISKAFSISNEKMENFENILKKQDETIKDLIKTN